ncbi:GNAT family N-acetyltransferase [Paenibacillus bovis]|uniref:N-acetyltransferase domain-containing protein n=1 Tax=Paenibacillus bovis TaxID=1616788 RepID=A0A172ZEY8_9BACL|nr:GNAT family N-acetyltransferase [Paenibacillus bovis]ANF96214.1 hypothetical protein AR543_09520 [Paenibacillus bovis]
MIIRPAQSGDYEQVLDLMIQLHQLHSTARPDIYRSVEVPSSAEQYDKQLQQPDHYLYIAEDPDTGQTAGYLAVQLQQNQGSDHMMDRRVLFINEIVVNHVIRGRGIGRQMFDYVKELAASLEVQSIELNAAVFNEQALAFYEGLGMKSRSIRMEYELE